MTSPVRHILMVEDNPGDAVLIGEMLKEDTSNHWKLSHETRMEKALIRTDEESFDVALLDLNLPDSTGLMSVSRLTVRAPELPVVVLTGHADVSLGEQALASGAQDYLCKDEVVPALLSRALRYAIERQDLHRRLNTLYVSQRQAQERAALEQLSEQHEITDEILHPLSSDYGRLALVYVQAVRNREPRPTHRLLGFAWRLARMRLAARDVLRLHLLMLDRLEKDHPQNPQNRRELGRDLRLALLELMGNLVDAYRSGPGSDQSIGE